MQSAPLSSDRQGVLALAMRAPTPLIMLFGTDGSLQHYHQCERAAAKVKSDVKNSIIMLIFHQMEGAL